SACGSRAFTKERWPEMASLYQRKGSSKWWIKSYRPGQRTRPDRIPTGTADYKEAKQILEAMVGDKAKGLPVNPKAHTIQFWQLAEAVLDNYVNEGFKTLNVAKGRFVNHIVPFFGQMVAIYITTADIDRYRAKRRKEGAAFNTIRNELTLVSAAFT